MRILVRKAMSQERNYPLYKGTWWAGIAAADESLFTGGSKKVEYKSRTQLYRKTFRPKAQEEQQGSSSMLTSHEVVWKLKKKEITTGYVLPVEGETAGGITMISSRVTEKNPFQKTNGYSGTVKSLSSHFRKKNKECRLSLRSIVSITIRSSLLHNRQAPNVASPSRNRDITYSSLSIYYLHFFNLNTFEKVVQI
eukprot:gene1485-874_t